MPERDAPRLLATAYREAKQAAIAGLGVGKFGRRRPFPVDRLGHLPAHAPTLGGQFQRILRQGQMAIAPGLARPGSGTQEVTPAFARAIRSSCLAKGKMDPTLSDHTERPEHDTIGETLGATRRHLNGA